MRIGALEAGGTKMVCAVGREDGTILEQMSIPTTTPEETIPKIISYFKEKDICALGVAVGYLRIYTGHAQACVAP